MDRLFLDANVLFSTAYREDNGLLQLWELPNVELVTSSFAASETDRNLAEDAQRQRLAILLTKTRVFDMPPSVPLPAEIHLPQKDAPILAAAIEVQATHLLTGDKRHFGALFGQYVAGVLVEPPGAYLARRRATQG